MPLVRMTRAEYEAQYGNKPVVATSTLDNDPIPLRMTRAEYNALYRPQEVKQDTSAVGDLKAGFVNAKQAFNTEADRQNEINQRGFVGRNFGRFTSGLAAAGGALSSIGEGAFRALPGGTTVANTIGDVAGAGIEAVSESVVGDVSRAGFQALPEGVQTYTEDVGRGVMGALGVAGALVAPGATSAVARPVVNSAQEVISKVGKRVTTPRQTRAVERVASEIEDIENNYAKTRNKIDRDPNVIESRTRIAQSNVLDNAVDTDGLIRTKQKGGAIEQYKNTPITSDGLTLLDVEDVVRRNLEVEDKRVNLNEIKVNAYDAVLNSGLEGADLSAALKRITKDIEGLAVRADEFGDVLLSKIQDAKISTTKNIDYTKPVGTTYRKTLARVYKETIEEKSGLPVKEWNQELQKYYKDIDRLADLDGKRVKGGRLGKYTANVAGSAIGAVAGTAGGGPGALFGGIFGGEVASALRGRAMAGTFRRGVDGKMPESRVLADADARAKDGVKDLKTADPQVGAPKTLIADPDLPVEVRTQITKLESQIKNNVKKQNDAIKAGDFTLVAVLKDVYLELVDRLKAVIADYRKNGPPIGLSIRKSITPESVAQKADAEDMRLLALIIDNVGDARLEPNINRMLDNMGLNRATDDELVAFAKEVFDEKDGVANRPLTQSLNADQANANAIPANAQNISSTVDDVALEVKGATPQTTLLEEAKGKTLDEFVKGQGTPVYHGGAKEIEKFEVGKKAIVPGRDVNAVYLTESLDEGQFYANFAAGTKTKNGGSVTQATIDTSNLNVYDAKGAKMKTQQQNKIVEQATKDGFDGVHFKNVTEEYEGIPFNSEKPVEVLSNQYAITNTDIIKTKSQLEDIWNQANKPSLLEEAKKYKSAEEFVKASTPVFRGGNPVDKSKVTFNGISTSKERSVADQWRGTKKDGVLEELYISPVAKVYKPKDVKLPINFAEKQRLTIQATGDYDVLDLSDYGEAEMVVLNPDVLLNKKDIESLFK